MSISDAKFAIVRLFTILPTPRLDFMSIVDGL
jgi:hypothetical protein